MFVWCEFGQRRVRVYTHLLACCYEFASGLPTLASSLTNKLGHAEKQPHLKYISFVVDTLFESYPPVKKFLSDSPRMIKLPFHLERQDPRTLRLIKDPRTQKRPVNPTTKKKTPEQPPRSRDNQSTPCQQVHLMRSSRSAVDLYRKTSSSVGDKIRQDHSV